MPEKWEADRELNTEIVGRVLAEQFPEYPNQKVEYLGSGWDFDAYVLNGDVIVRFPRREEVAELLPREEQILSILAPKIGSRVNIPEICLRGEPGELFPYPFFGHWFIPGVAADHDSISRSPELAADIGTALTALHGVRRTNEMEEFFGFETEGCKVRFEETKRLVNKFEAVQELAPAACRWLLNEPTAPSEFNSVPRFIHNDLCPDHLIVNSDTGRLSGIIDWSDVAFGDPMLDFLLMVLWGGSEFRDLVLDSYDLKVSDGFVTRLSFLSKVLSIKWLIEAIRRDGDLPKHKQWVANAFSG